MRPEQKEALFSLEGKVIASNSDFTLGQSEAFHRTENPGVELMAIWKVKEQKNQLQLVFTAME